MKKQIAEKLNGINFPCEIPIDIIADLAVNNLVAAFFISDDLIKLTGSISDEVYNCSGDFILFNSEGIEKNECEEGVDCHNFREKESKALAKIEIGDFEFITDIPHETFNIFEDGELYCIGIVFDMKDLSTTGTLKCVWGKLKGIGLHYKSGCGITTDRYSSVFNYCPYCGSPIDPKLRG